MNKAQKREFMLKHKFLMEPPKEMILPREMTPSKELFEKVGFSFKEFENPYYYITILPEGWLISGNYSPNANQAFAIYDSNLNARVNVHYSTPPKMELVTRFQFGSNENEWREYDSVALVTDQSLAIASFKLIGLTPENLQAVKKMAEDFLNKNYPDWQDPLAYWDE